MSIRFNGFDDLQRHLEKLQKNAENLSRQKEVPFSSLFTASFMRKCTNFSSFDELLEAGGFHAETTMATEQYVAKQLGF